MSNHSYIIVGEDNSDGTGVDQDGDEGDGGNDDHDHDNYHRSSRMDEDPSPGNINNLHYQYCQ